MTRHRDLPKFSRLEGVVSDRVLDAARAASRALTKAGIPHALIGGIAVGAYGYMRATKDVDFVVGENGFVHHGPIVTFAPGVPINIGGVPVDILSDDGVDEQTEEPVFDGDVPFVSIEALVYLKLVAFRRRDQEDVVELLKAGIDEDVVREYLEDGDRLDERLVQRFDQLCERADTED